MKKSVTLVKGLLLSIVILLLSGMKCEAAYSAVNISEGFGYCKITDKAAIFVNMTSNIKTSNFNGSSVNISPYGLVIAGEGYLPEAEYSDAFDKVMQTVKANLASGVIRKITSITIEKGIENIPQQAFCPASHPLMEGAFSEFSTNFNTDSNWNAALKSIGVQAFDGSKILDISLPKSVTSIGVEAFCDCANLVTVNLGRTQIEIIDRKTFQNCNHLRELTLPSTLKAIEDSAFQTCKDLSYVELPQNLQSIGKAAFSGSGLMEIFIPDGVTTIEKQAFRDTQLRYVTIGDSIKTIPEGCFSSCTALRKIYWGNSVEIIEREAFYECAALEKLALPKTLKEIGYCAFTNFDEAITVPRFEIPEGVEKIGSLAFVGIKFDELVLPASLTELGADAFILKDAVLKYTGTKEQFESIKRSPNEEYIKPDTPFTPTSPQSIEKYKVTSVSLDQDVFWYDSKVHAPVASVMAGRTVIMKGYTSTSTYASLVNDVKNYKPGTYKVVAKGIAGTEGMAEATYKIAVKPTKLKKTKVTSKTMTVTVEKQKSQYVNGYEAQYSTKANMKKAKKVTIGKTCKAATGKISKLKPKTTYYVQVRSYVNVGKKKYYSDWSEVKTIKTKK